MYTATNADLILGIVLCILWVNLFSTTLLDHQDRFWVFLLGTVLLIATGSLVCSLPVLLGRWIWVSWP